MKYLSLVLKNARRNRRRTVLTLLSVMVAVFGFCSLRAVIVTFQASVDSGSATRMVVIRSTSIMFTLQKSQEEIIRQTPGVTAISIGSYFGGIYKDPSNYFAQYAIDAESYLRLYPEMLLEPGERAAFLSDRTGAIVGDGLARRYGFKVGDRIVLQVGIPLYGTQDFTFTIRGIYRPAAAGVDDQSMFFHWQYLNERSLMADQVGWFVIELERPDVAASVAEAIDRRFANTPYETRTESEKAFATEMVSMLGNIGLLIGGILAAVIVTTLFVAGNTMAMSVRERTLEIAVMRTLGFRAAAIFLLVAGEAALMALVGGALGAGLAWLLFTVVSVPLPVMGPGLVVGAGDVLVALLLSVGIGVGAGLIPASMAARLKVVDALRRVA